MKDFPHFKQPDSMDCGPTCLKIVAKHFGRNYKLQRLRDNSGIARDGVSLLGISEAAEKIGFRTAGHKVRLNDLCQIELPCIIHWDQKHFVVLYKTPKKADSNGSYFISDPSKGLMTFSENEFASHWGTSHGNGGCIGFCLTLSPTPEFYELDDDPESGVNIGYLMHYIYQYKKLIIQLFLGLIAGSLLQLMMPFLTQAVVDIGINARDLNFIHIILLAQCMLLVGRISIEFIRSWILLHITSRVNISILTDFLMKLMKLPIAFFDTKMTGDIMQRLHDQNRIQSFLTGSSITTIFSLFNLIVFAAVLAHYNLTVFCVFTVSSLFYGLWIVIFLNRRRQLDFKLFDLSAENQNQMVELIGGMEEIKLNNCERQKRWDWEKIQVRLFRLSIRTLKLGQYQQAGTFLINEGKNIFITFVVAKSVIMGNMTLGEMMAIQYIVGQLNSPIDQLIGLLQQFQDAKISLERLNEIHEMPDEEPKNSSFIQELPPSKTITFHNVSFSYPGAGNKPILSDLNIIFPEGKTTAIVGMSGSGKTTILKVLLRFYKPQHGEIKVGNSLLSQIGYSHWRDECGIVMQDGFIFSDTVLKNIAVSDEYPDMAKVVHAVKVANIIDFIQDLPLGLHTQIGASGNGISQGQKQRLLIARAVYKDPEYIFFDEATNALDANNEMKIMDNLFEFFSGRTVIIVAHRLSTVKNADNIIVLDKGKIIEQGSHLELSILKGAYYELVKNQLELGA